MKQSEINALLIEKAAEGYTVVRLKGGDPSVFGRVGEEAEALHQHGIRYEMVPGITSGIASRCMRESPSPIVISLRPSR